MPRQGQRRTKLKMLKNDEVEGQKRYHCLSVRNVRSELIRELKRKNANSPREIKEYLEGLTKGWRRK